MTQSGTIQIQAVTSRADFPVPGATVSISRRAADGTNTLLAVRQTDESGLTQPVTVATPALENSLQPDLPVGWTDVRVVISHPGYEGIVVNQVQIFPGVATVQEMVMIPNEQLPEDLNPSQTFDVPDQGL